MLAWIDYVKAFTLLKEEEIIQQKEYTVKKKPNNKVPGTDNFVALLV